MLVSDLLSALFAAAPAALAEEWDNVGLLAGDARQEVSGILVCLDATLPALEAATASGANLVVAHHPLFLKPQAAFTPSGDTWPAWEACRRGLSVICMHTNLDSAPGGLADEAAAMLGLLDSRPLAPAGRGALQKLVVFVPRSHQEQVLAAISEAGAGVIGKYDYCSFAAPGTGTFRAQPGAQPYLGKVGEIERAEEVRLETVLPRAIAGRVVRAMLAAHPYEEVAFDLYHLENAWPGAGLGRLGRLPETMAAGEFMEHVSRVFGAPVRAAGGPERIGEVAILPGGGGRAVPEAAAAGADALVTGDAGHHDAQAAVDRGILLVAVGHYRTEIPAVPLLARLCRAAAPRIEVREYLETNPWKRE